MGLVVHIDDVVVGTVVGTVVVVDSDGCSVAAGAVVGDFGAAFVVADCIGEELVVVGVVDEIADLS